MVIHVTITEYDNLYVCEHKKKKREKKSQNKNFQSLLENNS